jgi:hypothetical protein
MSNISIKTSSIRENKKLKRKLFKYSKENSTHKFEKIK